MRKVPIIKPEKTVSDDISKPESRNFKTLWKNSEYGFCRSAITT